VFQEQPMYADPSQNAMHNSNQGYENSYKNDEIGIDMNALATDNFIDQQPFMETRPPQSVPSVLETGPPTPPSNVQSKDGAYPCPYVQCYARRIQDKEVIIQTDCWERVLVSTWRRVKKPCKVRIPQYEPVCYNRDNCRPKPTKQRLEYTTYSAPKSFDRNDDGILDAAERDKARAAGQLRVERIDPRQELNRRGHAPPESTTIKTTYQAPRKYDINKNGVLDANERALAAKDGKLDIIKKEVVPDPNQAIVQPRTSRASFSSSNRILEVAEREHARRYGDQIRDERAY